MVSENPTEDKTLRDLMIAGAELIRIDHETLQKAALLHHRIPRDCLKRALSELDEYPETAERAWYSIPYKKHKDSDETILVEGPSVYAALPILRAWGNANVTCRFSSDTDDFIDMGARFIDYETNYVLERPYRVYKKEKKYGKIVERTPDKLTQAVQAGVSKSIRNVIVDALPRGFVDRYVAHARRLVAGGDPDKKLDDSTRQKLVDAFDKIGVPVELLEDKVGKKVAHFTGMDRAVLIGNYTAIVEGTATVDDIFVTSSGREPEPSAEPKPAPPEPPPPDDGDNGDAPPEPKPEPKKKEEKKSKPRFSKKDKPEPKPAEPEIVPPADDDPPSLFGELHDRCARGGLVMEKDFFEIRLGDVEISESEAADLLAAFESDKELFRAVQDRIQKTPLSDRARDWLKSRTKSSKSGSLF